MEEPYVTDVLQFIMADASAKGFVREPDLRKVFGTASKEARDEVLRIVSKKLNEIFGLKLHQDGARYYLSSELEIPSVQITRVTYNQDYVEKDSNSEMEDGLLISTIMFIFMAKKHVVDDEQGVKMNVLRDFLSKIYNIQNDVFTTWFGPAKTARFIAQDWLHCTVNRDASGDDTVFYDWGPRAHAVINKKKLLESFCDLYGTQPEDWPNHLLIANSD